MGSVEETDLRVSREKEFHDRRFSTNDGHRREDKFYRALHDLEQDFLRVVYAFGRGSDVLDYGCGSGERTVAIAQDLGAKSITGIDISPTAVTLGQALTVQAAIKPDFSVDNCENTSLPPDRFDLIYGNGIIHHLDTKRSVVELQRILKPGGHIVFYEPLGTNPLINLYRRLTPNSRSPDEHPLLSHDLNVIRDNFSDVQLKHYGLLTVAALPFYKKPEKSFVYRLAARLDRLCFQLLPPLRFLAWSVMIVARK
jgi:SAM-dependent methyltransferase